MSDQDDAAETRPSSKVARLIEEYDLGAAFGDRLERSWTAEGDERLSLRALADLFNERLLESAMRRAGLSTVDGEVDNFYRLLTADDVSSGMRTEARARLERDGVDVEQLERDFVTYQAIRSYLKEYRNAEYQGTSDEARVEGVADTIRRLTARLQSVTEGSLDQLRRTGRLTLGDFRLFVGVDVLCEDCGARYGVLDLLERGGCDCESD
ncbi:rod-determining factor RdfA [Halomarina ordinaria]|uniref:Rod-determining factor RdfA n=1 Tax=Halomarina ordinaria TaxID=3033939 RepID=A0ABD5UEM4_9EURY|nr:rod-determining factor RdfA [Halomarina sp. PSRA2]